MADLWCQGADLWCQGAWKILVAHLFKEATHAVNFPVTDFLSRYLGYVFCYVEHVEGDSGVVFIGESGQISILAIFNSQLPLLLNLSHF